MAMYERCAGEEPSSDAGRGLPTASSIATPCDAPVAHLQAHRPPENKLKFEIGQK
jgi:hypothetical protein